MRNPRNDPLTGSGRERPAQGPLPAAQGAACDDAQAPCGQADRDFAGAPRAERAAPGGGERRCVLTGRHAPREGAAPGGAMLRLALSPDGLVMPDPLARAPGRGAWIGVTREELSAALAKGRLKAALVRAFKGGEVRLPEDLPGLCEAALRKALAQRLGLEQRAGQVLLGFDRIAAEARAGRISALYHAADASEDGCRKLDQAWRVGSDAQGSNLAGTRLPLDREALSVALGRNNAVHVALADARSAGRIALLLGRLQTFLGAAAMAATNDEQDAGSVSGASA